jgi:hypothetical protein
MQVRRNAMTRIHTAAATAVLAVSAPAGGASTFAAPGFSYPITPEPSSVIPLSSGVAPLAGTITSAAGPCGSATGQVAQGSFGITSAQLCNPGGLTFIGPAIGQIASVIGPTIISPSAADNMIVVSAGNGFAG